MFKNDTDKMRKVVIELEAHRWTYLMEVGMPCPTYGSTGFVVQRFEDSNPMKKLLESCVICPNPNCSRKMMKRLVPEIGD